MYKLIIFDFDGTLVDTITDVAICFNKALEKCDLPTHDLQKYNSSVGGNLETVVSKLLNEQDRTKENISKVKKVYQDIYLTDKKENTKPYKNIEDVLMTLQNNGIKLAINSNKKDILLQDMVKKLFPNISFIKVAGYNEQLPAKPDPYFVNEIIELANVSKSETLYIGDGNSDIQTAKNANIDCMIVKWGQGKEEDYKNEYVKRIITDTDELFNIYK